MNRGIYCLVIQLLQQCQIKVGCLGTFKFSSGFYVYVGSAQNNLERRIARHLRRVKKCHWHIDYLLQYGEIIDVYSYEGEKDMECSISHKIGNLKNATIPAKGFGSSDCDCISHLWFFHDNPGNRIQKLMLNGIYR